MQKNETRNLIWFRNDLRTLDNAVLYKASKKATQVIGIYCLDPKHYEETPYGFKKTEKFRAKFLLETLDNLRSELEALNIDLLVYYQPPSAIIPKVCEIYDITDIHMQREWTQEEVDEEKNLQQKLPNSIKWHRHYNQFLFHPEDINFDIEKTQQVFTVFRKKLEKYVDIRKEVYAEVQPETNRINNSTFIPSLTDLGFIPFATHPNTAFPFKGGENEALVRLDCYFFQSKKLGFYKKTRNGLVGLDYSSKFSPWLANGSLSARTIYWKVKKFEQEQFKNQSTYWLIFELIWRDYFKYVSLKHGNAIFKLHGILNKNYNWSSEPFKIRQWINGETASDFVNANMIELKETGWMSNRGRQNVASYLAKDLFIDWRIGATYFESLLIDYDVHSNYGNWMYVSGVGNDPRDRKFNVNMQAERYDNNGKFRKLWLQKTLF